jgi:sugar diacid utilization regulator
MMTMLNLDGAVQVLADRIRQPVIIFDSDLAVAAFSVHEGHVDQARLGMILTHRVSERAAHMITEHRVDRAPGAVLLPVVAGVPSRVIAALRYRGRLTGYVSYVPGEDDDPDLRDAPDIIVAREELGALLAAREAERREGADRILQLVSRLLDGQQDQREAAAAEFIQDGLISTAPHYSVMVFRSMARADHSATGARLVVERVLNDIAMISSLKAVGTVIDGEGALIIPREVDPARLKKLLVDPMHEDIRSGGGAARMRLADVRGSRREARIALRATTHDPKRYGAAAMWSDLGLDRTLLQLPLERMTLDDLPPEVAHLITTSSGPDLAETLESYLDNGADAQKTAQRLYIHRSTLYYRLDRIRALIDSDLSDGTVRRELHTGLRIATLAGLR